MNGGVVLAVAVGLGLLAWSRKAKAAPELEPEPTPQPLVRTITDFADLYGLSYGAAEVLVAKYRENPQSEEFANLIWQQLVDLAYLAGLPSPAEPEPTPPEPEPTPPTKVEEADPCEYLSQRALDLRGVAVSVTNKIAAAGWGAAPEELKKEYRAAAYAYLNAQYENCCCQRQRGHKLNCDQIYANGVYQWLSWVGYK